MPTYEYVCPKCGYEFEQFQSMNDAPLKKCPKCKKAGVKRLVGGGAGLIFKGSGFYITDYKKKTGTKEGGGETKTETKSDTKPTEAKPASGTKPPSTPSPPASGSGTSKSSSAKK